MSQFKNIEDWRENYFKKLLDCRNEMMSKFSMPQTFNGRIFIEYMVSLINTHGKEIVSLLLSNTIRGFEFDDRYDREVKTWARNFPEIEQPPSNSKDKMIFNALYLIEHPCILNQAARITMQEGRGISSKEREQAR